MNGKSLFAPLLISILVVVGFLGLLVLVMSGAVKAPDNVPIALMFGTGFGILCAAFIGSIHFWLGSSFGSRTKDEVIAGALASGKAVQTPPAPPSPPSPPATPRDPAPSKSEPEALPAPIPPAAPGPGPAAPPRAAVITKEITGKVSTFGGPHDDGVGPTEGLSLVERSEMAKFAGHFLAQQPPGTSGLARLLDPDSLYIAMRWEQVLGGAWNKALRAFVQGITVHVAFGSVVIKGVRPIDWGPNADTGRIADLSPGLMAKLGAKTDDVCTITLPLPQTAAASAGAPPPTSLHLSAMAQSQADLERVFGKFTWTEGKGGNIDIDQGWIDANIVTIDIPQLHKFTSGHAIQCHRLIAEGLKAAFADIDAAGLMHLVLSYDGLWVPRHKNHDPSRGLSLHSWGAAIDINCNENPYGERPAPIGTKGSVVELIPYFERRGFTWGGYFGGGHGSDTDGMHFEYAKAA